jgi:hypothetical protein
MFDHRPTVMLGESGASSKQKSQPGILPRRNG